MVPGREEKIANFKAVTGIEDESQCVAILEAFGWNLALAISSMVDDQDQHQDQAVEDMDRQIAMAASASSSSAFERGITRRGVGGSGAAAAGEDLSYSEEDSWEDDSHLRQAPGGPGVVVWKIVTLPFSIIRGSYYVLHRAFGLGMWIAGGILSHSLGAFLGHPNPAQIRDRDRGGNGNNANYNYNNNNNAGLAPLLGLSAGAAEAADFVRDFEREYSGGNGAHLNFQASSFMDALRQAKDEYKFLFVYLHSPEHENTPRFCHQTLCTEAFAQFVNENFVAWGGNIRSSEGFRMSNSLKASTYPFCALVTAASNQRIAVLSQVEGVKSVEELLTAFQRILDEQGSVLVAARVEEEERRMNRRLREDQDAAYEASLQADRERERQRQEEAEKQAREAAEAERKQKEAEEAIERATKEAAERVAVLEQRRQEKALALQSEPDKGPNVTEVVIRFPNGERKERRFFCDAPVLSVYDFVDSLHFFDAFKYKLVSNFPRVVYGPDKFTMTLTEAGLHPRASLYVQVEDS